MIEVRSFDGDPNELVAVINRSWQDRYLAKDLIPVYDRDALEWQVLRSRSTSQPLHLAAYDKGKIVGCVLAERLDFLVDGKEIPVSQGSWFSVLPEYASSLVATKLLNTLERRHREMGLGFFLGYMNRSPSSKSFQFWKAFAKAFPKRYRNVCTVHFWMRFVRHRDVAAQLSNPYEAAYLRCLSWVQPRPRTKRGGPMRPFRSEDLEACQRLLQARASSRGFGQTWSCQETLLRHLTDTAQTAQASTIVLEGETGIAGLASTFPWPMKSKGVFPAAVVDVLHASKRSARLSLLRAATADAADRGAAAVVAPVFSWADALTYVRAGYLPIPEVCTLAALFADPALKLDGIPAALRFR
jgi:GNAT superfamily N-acetyltransferase